MQARSSASTWLVEHIIAAAEGDPGRRTPGKGRFYSQFSFNIFLFRRTLWMVVFMSSLISAPIVAFKSGKTYFLKNRQIFLWGGLIFQETHVKEAVWATSFPIGSNSSSLHKILWGAWGQKEPGNLDEDEYCSVLIYFHLPGDLFCGFWAKPQTCRTSAGSRGKLRHLRNQGSH